MSTILKALRRLEEERAAKTERALREQVVGSAPHASRNWRRLVLRALVALAGVLVVGLGLHSFRARPVSQGVGLSPASLPAGAFPAAQGKRTSNAGAQAPQGPAPPTRIPGGETGAQGPPSTSPPLQPLSPAASQPLSPAASQPSPAEVRAAAAALSPAPDVAVVPRPPPTPAIPPEPPQGGDAPRARAGAAPGSVPPSQGVASAVASPEPSSDAEAVAPSAPIRLQAVDPSIHSPYGLHEETPSPHASQARAPHPRAKATAALQEIVVTRTIWHPSAERRVAMVRGAGDSQEREVREGESVGSLQVLRIEPSDVVFLRDGVEVRQRVGTAQ